ncbi:FKBP-like protein [Fomitiporia mediterranea MF3/22]|uniref:FKBP-like protein n=1 Tax=Fomitiporia mediterranea (strain MF3/22) TaxID=694068 RepID=UPI000440823C|nr:FKBP-like protein [Fomitiporia mediterranea MF3/22]EJD03152.1 FKBP-like protein [Fomitiporia mediterranea MF3/22]
MSVALAVWSVRVEPGKISKVVPQGDIRITGAALDAELKDQKTRSSVKLTYMIPQAADEDEEEQDEEPLPSTTSVVLCSLIPGQIEQSSVDLVINEDDEVDFEIVGKNAIYLSGNYISMRLEQSPQLTGFSANESSEFYSDEETYDLRDVSSDVEMDASELDELEEDSEEEDSHRFEEIKDDAEEAKAVVSGKKRPREPDVAESAIDGETKLSKKQQKKLNKKLKAEGGEAVPNGEVSAEKKPEEKKPVEKTEEKKGKEKKKEKKEGEKAAPKKPGELKELPNGLKVKDAKTGTGKAAKKGDMISMRYIGKFTNGKVFDQNTQGKPFTFKLGAGEVIKGWDEGIAGMQAGGERLLIVPPNLGYGARKIDGIPANSTLRFECKLLEIKS